MEDFRPCGEWAGGAFADMVEVLVQHRSEGGVRGLVLRLQTSEVVVASAGPSRRATDPLVDNSLRLGCGFATK